MLENYLRRCRIAYYNGKPIIPDDVYDRLTEGTIFDQEVGDGTNARIQHAYPKYSLQKCFVGEQLISYDSVTVNTPKLDGAAVSILYLRGEFQRALTRGDGKRGIDISDKMRFLVPTSLPYFIDEDRLVQITGEVVAPKEIPNARNYAAGALNLKDLDEFQNRDLTFIAYGVQPYFTESWTHDLEILDKCGFQHVMLSEYNMFPHDGRVVRVDAYDEFDKLGYTQHHPRGAYALKDRSEGTITKLLDVIWQVGKSGVVSPVAILEPCVIGGATVQRATLHNMGFIDELELEIGCDVEVIRSGEIIPRIVRRVNGS